MRVFALSDVHADFEPNARWLRNLSLHDYQADVLILAGDVTDSLPLLEWCLGLVARRFHKVLFVPGNHELWTLRDSPGTGSFEKFDRVRELAHESGASMEAFTTGRLSIVPLLSWYDYSFGTPSAELAEAWMDFRACVWPPGCEGREITARFLELNERLLAAASSERASWGTEDHTLISFSHFLPRAELVPARTSALKIDLSPVLGSGLLDRQVRQLGSTIHVYGHSHVNRKVDIDAVKYVNNAFGYPNESGIAAKRLACIHEA